MKPSAVPTSMPMPTAPIVSIATRPGDVASACAGYPHQHPASPSKGSGSGSKMSKVSTIPSMNIIPTPPPGHDSSDSSSVSDHGHGRPKGGPGGPPGDPGGGSPHGSGAASPHRNLLGVGVGEEAAWSEDTVRRSKALQPVKVDSLPQDAAAYRGWKNGLVTKLCSIDVTVEISSGMDFRSS